MFRFCLFPVLVLILLCEAPVTGQSLKLTVFEENEGLTNTLIKSVTSDNEGFIWIATDDGLFRFDGFNFMRINDKLPSQYVKTVFFSRDGQLLASTDFGIVKIVNSPNEANAIPLKMGSVSPTDSLLWFPKSFYQDRDTNLSLSDSRRVYCFKGTKVLNYSFEEKAVTNNFQRSFSLAEDSLGNLFCFSEPGFVFHYNRASDSFNELNLPVKLTNIQYAICTGRNSFFVATHTGLFELKSSESGEITEIKDLQINTEFSCLIPYAKNEWYAGSWSDGLFRLSAENQTFVASRITEYPGNNVNNLFLSSDGELWIASDNGLFLLKRELFGAPYKQFVSSYIQSIYRSPDGSVWFTDGKTVYRVAQEGKGVPAPVKKSTNTIQQALPVENGVWYSDADGKIWFEDLSGKVIFEHQFGVHGRAVFKLTIDRSGNVYGCQDRNNSLIRIFPDFTVREYGVSDGLSSIPLTTVVHQDGRIYIGGMRDSAYLFTLEPKTGKITNISLECNFPRNIDLNVNDMVFDAKGTLWLGTSFGLLEYSGNRVQRVDLGEMTSTSVKTVTVDKDGNIWFGNSGGLHRIIDNEVLSFDERTGLPSKIIGYRCLLVDDKNRLWAGTVSGLAVTSPPEYPDKTLSPIFVSILLNNKQQLSIKETGNVISDKSFVSIRLAVPDYPARNLTVEMYLQGRDSTWSVIAGSKEIIFANLNTGKYVLMVRARQLGNFLFSDPVKWEFQVRKVWYFRWWAILTSIFLLFAGIISGIRVYTHKLKYNNEKLEHAVSERTREIIQQKEWNEEQNKHIIEKNKILEQVNEELQVAKAKAEEAVKAKSRFLSVMSHELRTPLNAMIGVSHLLMMEDPKPEQSENLKILMFSAESLLALINDILDFNKLEAGKVSLEKVRFNLRTIVEEVKSIMMLKSRANNNELILYFDNRIPEYILGDPLRLSQIINNLVDNALKFTKEGTVRIDVALNKINDKQLCVDFTVSDTGIGIPKEALREIFDMCNQAQSETSRVFGGTGLGLAITKKLLDLHESTISVESETGKGTRFFFTLCYDISQKEQKDKDVPKGYVFKPFNKQRILLVEDNNVNRTIANSFLTGWNLNVDIAQNGLEAVDKVKTNTYELILMDLQMPEMDGYQASAAIRAMGDVPWTVIPIVALTAYSKSDVYEDIFRSGMNDFVAKPFNPVELHSKLSHYLHSNNSSD